MSNALNSDIISNSIALAFTVLSPYIRNTNAYGTELCSRIRCRALASLEELLHYWLTFYVQNVMCACDRMIARDMATRQWLRNSGKTSLELKVATTVQLHVWPSPQPTSIDAIKLVPSNAQRRPTSAGCAELTADSSRGLWSTAGFLVEGARLAAGNRFSWRHPTYRKTANGISRRRA